MCHHFCHLPSGQRQAQVTKGTQAVEYLWCSTLSPHLPASYPSSLCTYSLNASLCLGSFPANILKYLPSQNKTRALLWCPYSPSTSIQCLCSFCSKMFLLSLFYFSYCLLNTTRLSTLLVQWNNSWQIWELSPLSPNTLVAFFPLILIALLAAFDSVDHSFLPTTVLSFSLDEVTPCWFNSDFTGPYSLQNPQPDSP